MSDLLFVDTGGFYSFLSQSDVHHREAEKLLLKPTAKMTSNYVLDELVTLLSVRGHKDIALSFGEKLRLGTFAGYHFLTPTEEEKAWHLYKKYKDHDLSFTDCTTLILLKEHRVSRLVSFDQELIKLTHAFLIV